MKITWLGQAGLLFETNNTKIIVDPYLSDSVEKIEPHNKRRVAVNEEFLRIKPDIIVLTHNHLDHTDPETLKHYLNAESQVCVLASYNAWQTARKLGGIKNNCVMFNRGTVWTHNEIVLKAVYAEHSDFCSIGVIIEVEDKKYYVTGDTLYNQKVLKDLPSDIDYVFLPVNGRGNNMNIADATKFCEQIRACAIPLHCGLFDELDMNNFAYERKVVPEFYKEIKLQE